MPDEYFVEVGLDVGVAEGFEVGVIQVLPVFAAAGQVETLIGVLLQERRHIQLVLLFRNLSEAVPIEYTVKSDFILSLEVVIDDGVLEDILAVGDEEVAEEEGESGDKEQYVLRDDLVGEHVNGEEAEVGRDVDGEHHSLYVHEQLVEIDEFVQIEGPVVQLDCQHEETVYRKTHRVHQLSQNRES